MDPNLHRIAETNMYSITHGSVQQAIFQAEDYLRYINPFDLVKAQQELDTFIAEVKEIRRRSRGKGKKERSK